MQIESTFGHYIARSQNSRPSPASWSWTWKPLSIHVSWQPSIEFSRIQPLKFDAIVEGYKMRIDVVRELVPNCKIGLYGFPTPHAHGKADSAVEVRRTMGYELAAARGILDQVDTICPVLYQRFGATDSHYHRIADYMQVGVDTGRSLRRQRYRPRCTATVDLQDLQRFLRPQQGAGLHRGSQIRSTCSETKASRTS